MSLDPSRAQIVTASVGLRPILELDELDSRCAGDELRSWPQRAPSPLPSEAMSPFGDSGLRNRGSRLHRRVPGQATHSVATTPVRTPRSPDRLGSPPACPSLPAPPASRRRHRAGAATPPEL